MFWAKKIFLNVWSLYILFIHVESKSMVYNPKLFIPTNPRKKQKRKIDIFVHQPRNAIYQQLVFEFSPNGIGSAKYWFRLTFSCVIYRKYIFFLRLTTLYGQHGCSSTSQITPHQGQISNCRIISAQNRWCLEYITITTTTTTTAAAAMWAWWK
jgi:hypothetical protein